MWSLHVDGMSDAGTSESLAGEEFAGVDGGSGEYIDSAAVAATVEAGVETGE